MSANKSEAERLTMTSSASDETDISTHTGSPKIVQYITYFIKRTPCLANKDLLFISAIVHVSLFHFPMHGINNKNEYEMNS